MDKTHRDARKGEHDAADRWKGTLSPASGSGPRAKNDFRTVDELVEYKYTEKKSFSLVEEQLLDLNTNAVIEGRVAVFLVEFAGGTRYAVLREDDFFEYVHGTRT
jgi:hypothetical protein